MCPLVHTKGAPAASIFSLTSLHSCSVSMLTRSIHLAWHQSPALDQSLVTAVSSASLSPVTTLVFVVVNLVKLVMGVVIKGLVSHPLVV